MLDSIEDWKVWCINVFEKKTGLVRTSKRRANLNEFAQELHKTVIEIFKRRKVNAMLRDNIWVKDLGKKRSFPSKNWGVKYLLCVVDVFIKYTWITPLKEKLIDKAPKFKVGEIVNVTNYKHILSRGYNKN